MIHDPDRARLAEISAPVVAGYRKAAIALGTLLAFSAAGEALAAESRLSSYATSIFTYDSNVFRVDNNSNLPIINGQAVRDDEVFANTLGFDGTYEYSLQQFHAKLEGRRYDYLQLPSLSHFEYLVNAGVNYVILSRVAGTIDYNESRRQSRFEDRNDGQLNTQLNFDRDRNGGISSRTNVADNWEVEGSYRLHTLSTPVVGASSLKLSDNTSTASLRYGGIAHLTAALNGNYLDGKYSGAPNATSFRQYGGDVSLNYSPTDISHFSVVGGYSTRRDSGFAPTSGLVGTAAYTWNFTAKSLTEFRAFRRISSYAAGDNTTVELGLSSESRWKPTEKLELELTYDYVHTRFKNAGLGGLFQEGRTDQLRTVGFRLVYLPLDWLQASTTTFYAVRKSSQDNNDFNAATISFTVTATLNK